MRLLSPGLMTQTPLVPHLGLTLVKDINIAYVDTIHDLGVIGFAVRADRNGMSVIGPQIAL
jgi:hypothetical protein